MDCIYLGEDTGRLYGDELPIYDCQRHGRCVLAKGSRRIVACETCKTKLTKEDPDFASEWVDPLLVTDRRNTPTDGLRDLLVGGAAFLVLGGPSLKSLPYHRLAERGVFSLAVNNVAGLVPVNAFVCSDPPLKFHHGIFTDPTIIKLLPHMKLRGRRGKLRRKHPDGTFEVLNIRTADCPNTWGFMRRCWLKCDETWFTENSASWGNNRNGVTRTGEAKVLATMLLGLRVLQYLGAKRIFLLGCDMYMSPTADLTANYAFREDRDKGAVNSNNNQYKVINDYLCRLRPVFERFGFETYNCNRNSHLRAFDYAPFDAALEVCRGLVPPGEFDLRGHYAKVEKYEEPEKCVN
jgi:hypothetical protein